MKTLAVSILIALVASGTAALAKEPKASRELNQALSAVAATATQNTSAQGSGPPPPDHFNPKVDNDQGDDNASPTAILKVCGMDTPAAQRAAICPVGISPD